MSSGVIVYRERWRYRQLRLGKWLLAEGDAFHNRQPMCEFLTEDGPVEFLAELTHGDQPVWLIGRFLKEGDTVPPSGYIAEYSDNGPRRRLGRADFPQLPPARIHAREVDVMISYRRADAEAIAGRLHEVLSREFGSERVFMDLFSIQPGEDWRGTVQYATAACRVMVVVIGAQWEKLEDQWKNVRLQGRDDPVHREVAAALERRIWVLPVLASRTDMPDTQSLPRDLQRLFDSQAAILTTVGWTDGVAGLVRSIRRALESS